MVVQQQHIHTRFKKQLYSKNGTHVKINHNIKTTKKKQLSID